MGSSGIYARVRQSMPEYAKVCQSMQEYAICKSITEYARVCQSMPEYARVCQSMQEYTRAYLIFVIFFTLAKFLENKIYTEKRQFFALNLSKMPIFRFKSVKIYTGQKNLH